MAVRITKGQNRAVFSTKGGVVTHHKLIEHFKTKSLYACGLFLLAKLSLRYGTIGRCEFHFNFDLCVNIII